MTDTPDEPVGFELPTGKRLPDGAPERLFYPLSATTRAKDLMVIDHFAKMSAQSFFQMIEDGFDSDRSPIIFALIATSMSNRHKDWSTERIIRTVENLSLEDVEFIGMGDDESPPAQEGEQEPTGTSSSSESNLSSSGLADTPTPAEPSETSSENPS